MRFLAVTLILSLISFAYAAELLHADSPDVIANEYIIVLKQHLTSLDKFAHILTVKDSILLNADASVQEAVTGDFGIGSFQGFFATLGADKLAAQLAHPNVKYVETNKVVRLSDYKVESVQELPASIGASQNGATWGLARVSERAKSNPISTTYHYNNTVNSIVDAYVIDTGILITHTDFGTRAAFVFNAISGEGNTDGNGHGTHVAGTVGGTTYGIHKTCALKAVKVLNAQGSGTNAGVISGINYVGNNHNAQRRSVANMSLGGGASTATDDAVNACVAKGIAFAVAAGNDNANACNYSPARAAQAVCVGATANTDARASFSNFGTCLTIFAPGQAITSDWIGSNTATSTISGTSMASPHVCGVLAKHREVEVATPAVLKAWLIAQSTPNVVTSPGTGSANRLLYSAYVH